MKCWVTGDSQRIGKWRSESKTTAASTARRQCFTNPSTTTSLSSHDPFSSFHCTLQEGGRSLVKSRHPPMTKIGVLAPALSQSRLSRLPPSVETSHAKLFGPIYRKCWEFWCKKVVLCFHVLPLLINQWKCSPLKQNINVYSCHRCTFHSLLKQVLLQIQL